MCGYTCVAPKFFRNFIRIFYLAICLAAVITAGNSSFFTFGANMYNGYRFTLQCFLLGNISVSFELGRPGMRKAYFHFYIACVVSDRCTDCNCILSVNTLTLR